MKGLIQRAKNARVMVENKTVGEIASGIVLLVGIEQDDDGTTVQKMLHKVLNLRIFADEQGKMNKSLKDVGGQLLIVSQFTLTADTHKGLRPSFNGAVPSKAKMLYDELCTLASGQITTQTGIFGADMQLTLTNDGPVTFMLEIS